MSWNTTFWILTCYRTHDHFHKRVCTATHRPRMNRTNNEFLVYVRLSNTLRQSGTCLASSWVHEWQGPYCYHKCPCTTVICLCVQGTHGDSNDITSRKWQSQSRRLADKVSDTVTDMSRSKHHSGQHYTLKAKCSSTDDMGELLFTKVRDI